MRRRSWPWWASQQARQASSLPASCPQCNQFFDLLQDLVDHVNDFHVKPEKDVGYCCHWEGCARHGRGFNARWAEGGLQELCGGSRVPGGLPQVTVGRQEPSTGGCIGRKSPERQHFNMECEVLGFWIT